MAFYYIPCHGLPCYTISNVYSKFSNTLVSPLTTHKRSFESDWYSKAQVSNSNRSISSNSKMMLEKRCCVDLARAV